jgi:WhiB family redox-sensing transcriptional regulator
VSPGNESPQARRIRVGRQAGARWSHPYAEEEWKLEARCRGEDPELWFPRTEGQRERNQTVRAWTMTAKAICAQCPVIADCLGYAMTCDVRYGIWGGMTEAERARLAGRKGRTQA